MVFYIQPKENTNAIISCILMNQCLCTGGIISDNFDMVGPHVKDCTHFKGRHHIREHPMEGRDEEFRQPLFEEWLNKVEMLAL